MAGFIGSVLLRYAGDEAYEGLLEESPFAAFLASESVTSLPSMPSCPATHLREGENSPGILEVKSEVEKGEIGRESKTSNAKQLRKHTKIYRSTIKVLLNR